MAKNLVSMLFGDSHVQQGYDFFSATEQNEETAWLADLSSSRVTYKGSLLGSLSRVYFYRDGAAWDFRSDKLYASFDDAERADFEEWYADAGRNYCFLTFTSQRLGSKPRYIYLLAKVPSATRLGGMVGLMQAEISTATFQRILDDVPASDHSALYLISSDGESFLSSGEAAFDADALRAFSDRLGDGTSGDEALSQLDFEGERYLAGQVDIKGTDWRLVMAVPARDLTAITRGTDSILLVTVLILLLMILPIAALVAYNLLNPVYRLQKGVNAIAQGDYGKAVPHSDTPELNRLIDSFNFMRTEIQRMMEEQYRMGRDLKNKELQLLQEQINPHFLYNTIDLLHWEARRAGNKEAEEITYALSQFYKLSLGHGEEIVTLGHELSHVAAYMRIQNIRFMNRIRFTTDVPEALLNVRIVKMVLQPLVENSIQHGIREKPDETGAIEIRARREGEWVVISVSDDGVGMDEGTIQRIVSSEQPGYGVYNVNDRLVLHYGSGAALSFESVPGEGTTATFRIPCDRPTSIQKQKEMS